ncbi:hypothetical protein [Actinomadura kijaniata]|uniref:hypothetical protein n=1 Tax=Actinomadura kijaniata TaxID=46161 RepID=UPI00082CBBB9|nr:hypothetical protein [Actinomadura kijaniata]
MTNDKRLWRARLIACHVTIAACVPYLFLKVMWLSGSSIGFGSTDMTTAEYVAGNAVTAGMDLVAVLVALAFTYPWGQRVPAWLVLVPIWVGTGLLTPIALGMPAGLTVQALAGGSPIPESPGADGEPWVFAVVYGGFTLQAIGLLTAFVLYARVRWADVFAMRAADLADGTTRPLQVLLANTAAVATIGYALVRVGWVLTGDTIFETAAQKTFVAVGATLAVLGAAGALGVVHRRGTRLLPALVAAWVGTGAAFTTGFMSTQTNHLVDTSGAIAGALLALATLLPLIETRRPAALQRI